ncbi:YwmB family TATA-box binding protein [Paenibacillus sp. CMAA1364]
MIFIAFILGISVIGLAWNTSEASQRIEENTSLASVLQLGEQLMDSPHRVIVKWQGEWMNDGNLSTLEAAQQLAHHMGLTLPQVSHDTDHVNYKSLTTMNGITITMYWQVISKDKSYMILAVEADDSTEQRTIIDFQDRFQTQCQIMKINAVWNMSLQGNVKEAQSIALTMNMVEKRLQYHMNYSQVETYQDVTTLSHSYQVPGLGFNLVSGDKYIDLQTAVHYDETLGANRITIGFPMITIEF